MDVYQNYKQQIQDYPRNTAVDEYDPYPRSRGGRSAWGYTIPGSVTNLCENPSVEVNTFWWGVTGGSGTRWDTISSRGVWAYFVVPNGTGVNGACYASVSVNIPAAGYYCFSIDVFGQARNIYRIYKRGGTSLGGEPDGAARTFHGCGFWNRELINVHVQNAGVHHFTVEHMGAPHNDNLLPYVIDGAFCGTSNFITFEHEYMDGDTPTAKWLGAWQESQSYSTPDGLVQTGMLNLSDFWVGDQDETPTVTEWSGASQAPLKQYHQPNLYYDGAELTRVYAPPRKFTISGYYNATKKRQYHQLAQTLETHTRLFPLQRRTSNLYFQPLECGKPAKPRVYISCTHSAGLGDAHYDTNQHKFTMQFEAPDPWFYRFNEEGNEIEPSGVSRVRNTSRLFVIPTFRFIGPGDLTSIENLYVDGVNYPTRIEFDPLQTLLTGGEVALLYLTPNQIRFEKFTTAAPNIKTIMHGAFLPTPNSHPTRFFLSAGTSTPIDIVSSYSAVELYWRPRLRSMHDR